MTQKLATYSFAIVAALTSFTAQARRADGMIEGKVLGSDGEAIEFATVKLNDTDIYASTDERGVYHISAPAGHYTAVFSAVGYQERMIEIDIRAGQRSKQVVKLKPTIVLKEVTVTGSTLSKVNNSAYNATAVHTRKWVNSNRSLSDALDKAPGMKVRQSGGVGSDMAVTMDGFTGKHVKVFIDGVAQEGAGASFSLNNIPAGYAERIEVYRGVVPVKFGADAIGGVINIVTPRARKRWLLDASYSYGSFNTHRTNVRFGQSWDNGLGYEVNAFQNYSDNDYRIDAAVEDFQTGAINRRKLERVRRFHDNYHNEALVAKVGVSGKPWADRLTLGMTYSRMYKDIQTGVRQQVVYGQKHRFGHALTPTLQYSKRDLLVRGLEVSANASLNFDYTTNVDTAGRRYNWRGESTPLNSPGEQRLQNSRAATRLWTAGATATYRLGDAHELTLNNAFNDFTRSNTNLLTTPHTTDEIAKRTAKNITGLNYTLRMAGAANVSVFGKLYHQQVSGPVATSSAQDVYVRSSRSITHPGYGMAATWFAPLGMQLKGSYEMACRLPSIDEMFGDEDLETGDMALRPETSHNLNLNISRSWTHDAHSFYAEVSAVYRDTRDYIQRNIMSLSGGKSAATYVNYGKVRTTGLSAAARYNYGRWLAAGVGGSSMNVRDNMRTAQGSTVPNLAYGQRMPNQPYLFADGDMTLNWHGLGGERNVLSLLYDSQFTKSFCYYAGNIGADRSDYMVPDQWAHNLTLSYGMAGGRYNLSLECRNLTDARLYDNFSLQKPGRAFYAKFRISLS